MRLRVTVGGTSWATSIFPDTERGAYLLPVKKDVRHREGLEVGALVHVTLEPSSWSCGVLPSAEDIVR